MPRIHNRVTHESNSCNVLTAALACILSYQLPSTCSPPARGHLPSTSGAPCAGRPAARGRRHEEMPAPRGGGYGLTACRPPAAPPTDRRRHALRCRSPPSPAHRSQRISHLPNRTRRTRTPPGGRHQASSSAPDSDRRFASPSRLRPPPPFFSLLARCTRE